MVKAYILFGAMFFLAYGLGFAFYPEQAFFWVTGGELNSPSAMIDLRATYGGMSIALALILFVLSAHSRHYKLALLCIILTMFGMGFGRVIGLVLDGQANSVMYLYLALEVVTATFSFYLMSKTASETP